jgi:hypothetical protein
MVSKVLNQLLNKLTRTQPKTPTLATGRVTDELLGLSIVVASVVASGMMTFPKDH